MAATAPLVDHPSVPEDRSSVRPRRPIATLMLFMLMAKIAYDVVMRRWAATISSAEKS